MPVSNGIADVRDSSTFSGSAYASGEEEEAFVSPYEGVNTVTPVIFLQLSGTTPDTTTPGQQDILVGQQCGASITGIPSGYTIAEEDWSATGTTFTGWNTTSLPVTDPTTTSYAPVLKPVVINSIPQMPPLTPWYWDDPKNNTTETITCKLTLTPPTGQTAPPPITLTSHVNVMVPTAVGSGAAGYMSVSKAGGLYAVPTAAEIAEGNEDGMVWTVNVTTPPKPAFGNGMFEIIQTVDPANSVVISDTTATLADPNNGITCLDKTNPYGPQITEPTQLSDWDSPGISLIPLDKATVSATFVDYLMYQPPTAGSNSVTFVPIGIFNWSVSGAAIRPGTQSSPAPWSTWVGTGTPSDSCGTVTTSSPKFSPSISFPTWTAVDNGWNPCQ